MLIYRREDILELRRGTLEPTALDVVCVLSTLTVAVPACSALVAYPASPDPFLVSGVNSSARYTCGTPSNTGNGLAVVPPV